ncbi:hypothetical protein HDU84_007453 [Entophlyctis sp. JEL0112]|nr:hypothetical protein HDU84_007453 [Entophlyctis sp. JEL0112]
MRIQLLAPFLATAVVALNNGAGRTPAMGWNSWNKFACGINESIVKQQAEALVSTGLAALGYTYVNIDDCWQLTRDAHGVIEEDPVAFPSGIAAVSQHVHALGLQFGLYSSAGTLTCQGRPGGLGHEDADARAYARWEVDYFKYDNCYNQGLTNRAGAIQRYGALRDALNRTGRVVNYALCSWGEASIWEFGNELGNSWRTTGDIRDSWDSVVDLIQKNLFLAKWTQPGGFNDMDMLEVGNGNMTDIEYRSHFSIWAALKSPLLLGNDLTNMSSTTFDIISNGEVIRINQDPLGKSAFVRAVLGKVIVWVGELDGGDRVLLIFNGEDKNNVDLDVSMRVFATDKNSMDSSVTWKVGVRDIWEHKYLGEFQSTLRVYGIPPHGVKMYRVTHHGGMFPPMDMKKRFSDSVISYSRNSVSVLEVLGWTFVIVTAWIIVFRMLRPQRRAGYVPL